MSRNLCAVLRRAILISFACAGPVSGPSHLEAGLIIKPTYDSSITNNVNSTAIISTINQAIATYQSRFSDNITVNIRFQNMNSGLGQSSKPIYYVSPKTYLTALRKDAKTSSDQTALSRLPITATDPVAGKTTMWVGQANLRALGYNMGTGSDGTIGLNTSITNFNRTVTSRSKYDLYAVAAHEIDEILGLGSGLNLPASYGGLIMPQDLFRYSATAGTRSFTTDAAAVSYFSIDGTAQIVQFNQISGADYGDWFSSGTHTPRVQDAFGTPGVIVNLSAAEYIGLDVIGYDLVGSPNSSFVAAQPAAAASTQTQLAPFVVSGLGAMLQIDTHTDLTVSTAVKALTLDSVQRPKP